MKEYGFTYFLNGTLPAPQNFRVSVIDLATGLEVAQKIPITLGCTADWCAVSPMVGSTIQAGTLGLTDAVKDLAPGTYQATLDVAAPQPVQGVSAAVQVTIRGEATLQDFRDAIAQVTAETSRIATLITGLLARLRAGGLTAAAENDVFTEIQTAVDALKSVGGNVP
jgi:hypothetical protein